MRKLTETLRRLRAFFSAEAFAQRGRDRERRNLVDELEELDGLSRIIKAREPRITERLQALSKADQAAELAAGRAKRPRLVPVPTSAAFPGLSKAWAESLNSSNPEADKLVEAWRSANPDIVALWQKQAEAGAHLVPAVRGEP